METKALTKEQFKEGNVLIAKFMGGRILPFILQGQTWDLWQECEIERINGCMGDIDLYFERDWNVLMQTWFKIFTLANDELVIDRVECGQKSIFFTFCSFENGSWQLNNILHSCYLFDNNSQESKDMKEVYWKSIVDFIRWYNDKR